MVGEPQRELNEAALELADENDSRRGDLIDEEGVMGRL
jgi:hypothetical protein